MTERLGHDGGDGVRAVEDLTIEEARPMIVALYDALIALRYRVPLANSEGDEHTCGGCRMCEEIAEPALFMVDRGDP